MKRTINDAVCRFLLPAFLVCFTNSSRSQTVPVHCSDFRGIPVLTVFNPRLNDIAQATAYQGFPVIVINPELWKTVSPQAQDFFYAHECGHHYLGHLVRGDRTIELQADCFGVRLIKQQGLISDDEIPALEDEVARVSPGDATHLGGMRRAKFLDECSSTVVNAFAPRGRIEFRDSSRWRMLQLSWQILRTTILRRWNA